MIGKKYIRNWAYKYKRFHVWFNKKIDKYWHNNLIVDMNPYDYKEVRRIQREANDHWSYFMHFAIIILVTITSFIIGYILIN